MVAVNSDAFDEDQAWLTYPEVVFKELAQVDSNTSAALSLPGELKQALKTLQCENLFELQQAMLSKIRESCSPGFFGYQLDGFCEHDFCVCSPTGSGKTLAYLLPVLEALTNLRGALPGEPKVLILAPSKDLVDQIFSVCKAFVHFIDLNVVKIGSSNVSIRDEAASLVEFCPIKLVHQQTSDVVIATPGRLVEHLKHTPGFSLKYLRFLIIDEADALFNMHPFFDWLQSIEDSVFCRDPAIPRLHPTIRLLGDVLRRDWVPLQRILVSATFPTAFDVLQPFHLQKPKLIIAESVLNSAKQGKTDDDEESASLMSVPSNISVKYLICEDLDKPLMFLHFLMEMKISRFLCFVNGSETAQKLFELNNLCRKHPNVCFLSKMKATQHSALLKKFTKGHYQGIIATDVLARGIDLHFDHVLIYDCILDPKTFVHRIGRCGRAGKPGSALSIVSPYEVDSFIEMTSQLGLGDVQCVNVDESKVLKMKPLYTESLKRLKTEVRKRKLSKK